MKLISMTSFIEEQNKVLETFKNHSKEPLFDRCVKYAEFLRQSITLGMFVPVEEECNILERPYPSKYGYHIACSPEEESGWMYEGGEDKYHEHLERWEKAKEKVLFEGFEIKENRITDGSNDVYFMNSNGEYKKHCLMEDNVEYMVHWDLELTPSALKQIGL